MCGITHIGQGAVDHNALAANFILGHAHGVSVDGGAYIRIEGVAELSLFEKRVRALTGVDVDFRGRTLYGRDDVGCDGHRED